MRTVKMLPALLTHLPTLRPRRATSIMPAIKEMEAPTSSSRARGNPCRLGKGVGDVGGGDQRHLGNLHSSVEPHVPCHEEADTVAEGKTSPFVEAALQGHQAVQMRDHQCVRE